MSLLSYAESELNLIGLTDKDEYNAMMRKHILHIIKEFFIGRIDDQNWEGIDLIKQIAEIYAVQGYDTQILAASVRTSLHIVQCATHGADVVTCPLSAILGLLKHPLTDLGLAQFLADHAKGSK